MFRSFENSNIIKDLFVALTSTQKEQVCKHETIHREVENSRWAQEVEKQRILDGNVGMGIDNIDGIARCDL